MSSETIFKTSVKNFKLQKLIGLNDTWIYEVLTSYAFIVVNDSSIIIIKVKKHLNVLQFEFSISDKNGCNKVSYSSNIYHPKTFQNPMLNGAGNALDSKKSVLLPWWYH